jgi:hypothetical protein
VRNSVLPLTRRLPVNVPLLSRSPRFWCAVMMLDAVDWFTVMLAKACARGARQR